MLRRDFIKKLIGVFFLIPSLPMFLVSCFSSPIKISTTYRSDHYDGKKFFHPRHRTQLKSFMEVMRWRWTRKSGKWPTHVPITADNPPTRVEDLRISFVGHATVLIQTAQLNILVDPVWDDYAGPVSFSGIDRITSPGIELGGIPPLDAILFTHNHYDHLSIPTLKRIQNLPQMKKLPVLYTPLGNKSIIDHAFPGHKYSVQEMDWGDGFPLNKTCDLFLEPALHWSGRGLSDRNKCLWGAFVLKKKKKRDNHPEHIYIAGDTAFGKDLENGEEGGFHFQEAALKYQGFRLAVVPIGAYKPRWFMKGQHINPLEALQAVKLLQARFALGIHLQTFFNLTDESYDDPVNDLQVAFSKVDYPQENFKVLKAGEVWEVPV